MNLRLARGSCCVQSSDVQLRVSCLALSEGGVEGFFRDLYKRKHLRFFLLCVFESDRVSSDEWQRDARTNCEDTSEDRSKTESGLNHQGGRIPESEESLSFNLASL
jgi:hypothetical protein